MVAEKVKKKNIYRITAVMKVETVVIASIAASPIEPAVILAIMYAKTSVENQLEKNNRLIRIYGCLSPL